MGKKENHTTRRIYKDPGWFLKEDIGEDPGELLSGGVFVMYSQMQTIREFVGLPLPWVREFRWTEKEFEKYLAPFFNGNPQDDYHNIAVRKSNWDPYLVSKREDIQKAIVDCVSATTWSIAQGYIKFDEKEIFKLKMHSGFSPCKSILYDLLSGLQKNFASEKWTDDHGLSGKYGEQTLEYINIFLKEFRKSMHDDITINWKILEKDQSNKKTLENITKLIKPPDPRLLDGKVIRLKSGKFRFNAVEDQHLEYKQSMFDPNISEIKQEKIDPDKYKKLLKGKENSLINEILSTVCAFLNTNDGELYIGVSDKPRQIIGLSDDRNSDKFKKYSEYTEFQEKYKIKILQLMKKKISGFEMSYVENIHYSSLSYGEDDNGDNIDFLCIPCQKIPSDKPPAYLRNELNEEGEMSDEEILYKRVDESDFKIPKKDEPRFLMDKQRIWAKREYHLDSDKDEGRTYSTDN